MRKRARCRGWSEGFAAERARSGALVEGRCDYEIYPAVFQDTNGDGIGDLKHHPPAGLHQDLA